MAMMISWVAPVNPSHPYLENDRLRRLTPTICAFHLGFSLETLIAEIIVDPQAPTWFSDLAISVVNKYQLQASITTSSLAVNPIW